jgi:predicted transcriptional regulator
MNQTITLPQSMMKRLQKITGTRRNPETIIKDAIKQRIEYEEWVMKEIEIGLDELAAGEGISHEKFWDSVGLAKNVKAA